MNTQKLRSIYSITLVILDALMVSLAFLLAYRLRILLPWPGPLESEIPLIR
jgi:hypothetical protein